MHQSNADAWVLIYNYYSFFWITRDDFDTDWTSGKWKIEIC